MATTRRASLTALRTAGAPIVATLPLPESTTGRRGRNRTRATKIRRPPGAAGAWSARHDGTRTRAIGRQRGRRNRRYGRRNGRHGGGSDN